MAIFKSLLGLVTGAAYRQHGKQSGQPAYYSAPSALPVTVDTSLQLSAVWACVKLISESISSLPLNVYKLNPDGSREIDKQFPFQRLMNNKVNRWQTRIEFFETMTYQLVLMGNAYAHIDRNANGGIVSLTPLMSGQMEVELLKDNSVTYRYTDGNNINIYSSKSIWHVKLFGNAIVGLSALDYGRNSLGIAQAAERSVTSIYQNGGKPSGVLMLDKILTPAQRAEIKSNFSGMLEGNSDRLFTLEAGMKFEQISLSPQDIELLASRRFQIEDIARFFGVPSVLINDTQAGTTWGSGIEQIIQGFYKFTIRPYLERYEASISSWLLTPEQRLTHQVEFDFNALLMPSMSERVKMYKEAIQGGLMTPNQARAEEGWLQQDGGDQLFLQAQMTPIKDLPMKKAGVVNDNQS